MTDFRVSRQVLQVQEFLHLLPQILKNPGYQREGGLWSLERQQLFIDSVLNGFDVPPIYLHRLSPPSIDEDGAHNFAVVDGLQRLTALEKFDEDLFSLAPDFRPIGDGPSPDDSWKFDTEAAAAHPFAGKRLSELKVMSPTIGRAWARYELPLTVVETDDEALIEELFFRLNEGVPLTPAEKRNRGALLRETWHSLLREDGSVLEMVSFRSRRRTHEDFLLRLLYVEDHALNGDPEIGDPMAVPDMRKRLLDEFAVSFTPGAGRPSERTAADLDRLVQVMTERLSAMSGIFHAKDPLLKTSTWALTYYLLIRLRQHEGRPLPSRSDIARFWQEVSELQGREEERMTASQREAMELAGPIPASTTGSYFDRRIHLLQRYLEGDLQVMTSHEPPANQE